MGLIAHTSKEATRMVTWSPSLQATRADGVRVRTTTLRRARPFCSRTQ